MTTSVSTGSPEETRALGRRLAAALRAGDVVALQGDLGSGKTELVKGLAEGLGVRGAVHSPTFVLHHHHPGPTPLEHYDLYRLEGTAWIDTGLDEPAPDAVTVIEWPERAEVIDAWASVRIHLTAEAEGQRRFQLAKGPARVQEVFDRAPGD